MTGHPRPTAAFSAPDKDQPPLFLHAIEVLVHYPSPVPLSRKEAENLLGYLHPYTIPAGEVFIEEGDSQQNDFAVLLLDGEVIVEATLPDGVRSTVNIVSPGHWLGGAVDSGWKPPQHSCIYTGRLRCALRDPDSHGIVALARRRLQTGCQIAMATCSQYTWIF